MASLILRLVVLATICSVSMAQDDIGDSEFVFENLTFSNWKLGNVTYKSSTGYNAMGMAPLYKIANQVIGLFVGEQVVPDGYLVFSEEGVKPGPKVSENEWGDLLKHYWALILVVVVCALIVVLMPIIGLCFCCCRCAGACGGRSQPFDKKHDTCRRVFLGLLLIITGTGMIFGVVVAFATSCYLNQGIRNATASSRLAVQDSQSFLKTTSAEANHLLTQNYDELSLHLTTMLNATAGIVINQLEEKSKAVSLIQLSTFVSALPDIRDDLISMQNITADLRTNASLLSDGLRSVKRELLTALTKCTAQACKDVLKDYKIGNLNINGIDYDKLPDLSEMIDNVNTISSGGSLDAIKDGQKKLDDIRKTLNRTIQLDIQNVTMSINNAGKAIQNQSAEMTRLMDRISEQGNKTFEKFDLADAYMKEYLPYHYYAALGVSAVLLLVLLCVVFGLLCGICGKRPDGYGDDCCNKGAGSRFLMCGVAIVFLTISALTVISLAYFLAGIVLQRGVCIPLQDPLNDQVFRVLDQHFNLNDFLDLASNRNQKLFRQEEISPLRISQVIQSCHNNQSIYNVLRLNQSVDIEELRKLPETYGIEAKLNYMISRITLGENLVIWPAEAQSEFERLRNSMLTSFDVHKILDNVNETITESNLSEIADKLERTASEIRQSSDMDTVQLSLRNQALYLRMYQEKLVDPMTKQSIDMLQMARDIDQKLKFNRTSFAEAMDELLQEVQDAERYINTEGSEFVRDVATKLSKRFLADINLYLGHVITKIQNDLGRCGPMSNVYKSMMVAGCNRVIDPFNGFWAGVAWCTLLFLPSIIISVKLSTLYQKSDPYPGPLVESEYLYDAYSERDNIPLANSGPKNKRRNKKNERRRSSRDRRGDYYEDSSSPHGPTSSGSRENRYNDMAPNAPTIPRIDTVRMFGPPIVPMSSMPYDRRTEPIDNNNLKYYQHWNGGPPRYQNPPMAPPASEYERPPPYYFPGAPSEGE